MMRINVGDRVTLSSGATGTVVGVIDRQEFARNLEAWRWSSFTRGLIVLLDDGVFTHVGESDIDAQLLEQR
jgi:preprotein translocase subunit YajC